MKKKWRKRENVREKKEGIKRKRKKKERIRKVASLGISLMGYDVIVVVVVVIVVIVVVVVIAIEASMADEVIDDAKRN